MLGACRRSASRSACFLALRRPLSRSSARTSCPRCARLRSGAWAVIPLAAVVGFTFGARALGGLVDGLTWLALICVPPLAAGALGWAMRGARPWLAPVAALLFALAWADRDGPRRTVRRARARGALVRHARRRAGRRHPARAGAPRASSRRRSPTPGWCSATCSRRPTTRSTPRRRPRTFPSCSARCSAGRCSATRTSSSPRCSGRSSRRRRRLARRAAAARARRRPRVRRALPRGRPAAGHGPDRGDGRRPCSAGPPATGERLRCRQRKRSTGGKFHEEERVCRRGRGGRGGSRCSPASGAASGAPGACTPSSLAAKMSVIRGSAGAGNIEYRVLLRNTGSSACSVSGHPALRLLGADGRARCRRT